ncbi:hypothetical protein QPK87_07530 [Kamptonema cortianum]|nr:hypothetical protein [Oscillatoria laete-virens]MDK3156426.1 hypothetical protein [Kamptonema cortianum]MDL5046285.1 hypothetical protein [Oscillatoria amoena NRMC-F 0135]MDL5053893.1 hypothetical protein [Oscillatoria laete-virens NRMC-F 0139]
MTVEQAYDSISSGGAGDFLEVIAACAQGGDYCLIGGLAVNHYVEPVYTMDADFVLAAHALAGLGDNLKAKGFVVEDFPHSLNLQKPGSKLRIQFTKDARYKDFPVRAVEGDIFGVKVKIASLKDLIQAKVWAWSDPQRRATKRKKDELDLMRIGETYPELAAMLPQEIRELIE